MPNDKKVLGFLGLSGLLGLIYLITRKHYATAVYQEVGVAEPEKAVGKPDGELAFMYGHAGNYLALQFFDNPTLVKSINLHLFSRYDFDVWMPRQVEISADGIDWIMVLGMNTFPTGEVRRLPPGPTVWAIPVDAPLKYIRIIQIRDGAHVGINAIEVKT